MPGKLQKRQLLTVSAVVLIIALTMVAMAMKNSVSKAQTLRAQTRKPQAPFQPVTDTLPPVISRINNLKVLKATIENQGTPDAMAVIELLNDSHKAVMGVTVTFGENSVGKDGGIEADGKPGIIIEPHKTITIDLGVNSLEKDVPLYVAGVIYADNTEDGQDIVLEMMHKIRAQRKARHDAEKGGSKQ